MKYPLDTSDEASLILADWHEEFGDIEIANEIREEVTDPKGNDWGFEFGKCRRVGGVGVAGGWVLQAVGVIGAGGRGVGVFAGVGIGDLTSGVRLVGVGSIGVGVGGG